MNNKNIRCKICGLTANYKNIVFDANGVCNFCHEAEQHTDLKTLLTFDDEEKLINSLNSMYFRAKDKKQERKAKREKEKK